MSELSEEDQLEVSPNLEGTGPQGIRDLLMKALAKIGLFNGGDVIESSQHDDLSVEAGKFPQARRGPRDIESSDVCRLIAATFGKKIAVYFGWMWDLTDINPKTGEMDK